MDDYNLGFDDGLAVGKQQAADLIEAATAEADALKERAKRAEDGWTEAVNQNAALRAEVEAYHHHLSEVCAECYVGEGHEAFLDAIEFLSKCNRAALERQP